MVQLLYLIIGVNRGIEVARTTYEKYVRSLAFSADGSHVVCASDNTVCAWEALTGEVNAIMSHPAIVGKKSVAFSPDGHAVVSGSWNKTICVWEASTGEEITRMMHDDYVHVVNYSLDGRYIASGSKDQTARVWDAQSGREVARMTHDSEVTSVDFSPDGLHVISGSKDRTARVWEAATGKEIARVIHDDEVSHVIFSPDGVYAASGSLDHTARVWFWRPEDLISDMSRYLPRNLTRAEWKQYIGDGLPYQAIFDNLPTEPE